MKRLIIIMLMAIIVLVPLLVIGCQQQPEPTPSPTPSVPIASLAEPLMASEIDSLNTPTKTASTFTDDTPTIHCCVKLLDAPANTEVKAEWVYVRGERSDLLDCVLFEHSLVNSGTCRLTFSQNRPSTSWPVGKYEVVLYLNDVKDTVVPFSILETPSPPPEPEVKALRLDWIIAEYAGRQYHIEGTVMNVGTVPLNDIRIELTSYSTEGDSETKSVALEPSFIPVGGSGHFRIEFTTSGELRTYSYRFLTPSGEVIPCERSD